MAIYFPGQQVVIAHPMKNHGTGPCTNKFIPDNGNWILQATQEWPFMLSIRSTDFSQLKLAEKPAT